MLVLIKDIRLTSWYGSLSHYLQGFSTIPGGAGFLPSTVEFFRHLCQKAVLETFHSAVFVCAMSCVTSRFGFDFYVYKYIYIYAFYVYVHINLHSAPNIICFFVPEAMVTTCYNQGLFVEVLKFKLFFPRWSQQVMESLTINPLGSYHSTCPFFKPAACTMPGRRGQWVPILKLKMEKFTVWSLGRKQQILPLCLCVYFVWRCWWWCVCCILTMTIIKSPLGCHVGKYVLPFLFQLFEANLSLVCVATKIPL